MTAVPVLLVLVLMVAGVLGWIGFCLASRKEEERTSSANRHR